MTTDYRDGMTNRPVLFPFDHALRELSATLFVFLASTGDLFSFVYKRNIRGGSSY